MKSSTNETGIPDHHKLIYTFLKSTYAKGKPKFVYYRCSKNFNKELFKKSPSENLKNIGNSFEVFYDFHEHFRLLCPFEEGKNSF